MLGTNFLTTVPVEYHPIFFVNTIQTEYEHQNIKRRLQVFNQNNLLYCKQKEPLWLCPTQFIWVKVEGPVIPSRTSDPEFALPEI